MLRYKLLSTFSSSKKYPSTRRGNNDSGPSHCPSTTQQSEEDPISYVMEVFKACDKKFVSSKSGLNKISPLGQREKFLHTAGSSMKRLDNKGTTNLYCTPRTQNYQGVARGFQP
ncbi:hypothetical protein AVEN_124495-1 [Araneus ventricosus]|uniref:Uncharacterized protein n=1 Tax=Araneus ventricosus TaxID=182803 RepID=A0A4Y2KT92_ARAVE|nr:hypothetical protein AVEN_124495-1 [Araneus ventricosus]